jgi:hypothetical protein
LQYYDGLRKMVQEICEIDEAQRKIIFYTAEDIAE